MVSLYATAVNLPLRAFALRCPSLRHLPGLVQILTSVAVVNVFRKSPIDELLPLIERLANKVWIEFQPEI